LPAPVTTMRCPSKRMSMPSPLARLAGVDAMARDGRATRRRMPRALQASGVAELRQLENRRREADNMAVKQHLHQRGNAVVTRRGLHLIRVSDVNVEATGTSHCTGSAL